MSMRRTFIEFWGNGNSTAEFYRAQYATLTRQIPLMYTILLVNVVTLSYIHFDEAPDYLTVAIPVILSVICIFRALRMVRDRHHMPATAMIRKKLRLTLVMAIGRAHV